MGALNRLPALLYKIIEELTAFIQFTQKLFGKIVWNLDRIPIASGWMEY